VGTQVFFNSQLSVLLLLWRVQQLCVFESLRDSEVKALSESLWQYALFKIVFLGVILEPNLHEFSVWATVLLISGYLKMSLLVAHTRIQHMMQDDRVTSQQHVKVFSFVASLMVLNVGWAATLHALFAEAGYSTVALLVFESLLVTLEGCEAVFKQLSHLLKFPQSCLYYIHFVKECLCMVAMLVNYLHMWTYNGIYFTLFDVLLFVHMRQIAMSLKSLISKHLKYVEVMRNMEARYPAVSLSELEEYNEQCLFCYDEMLHARKLPCGHMFHMECLQIWLQQEASCPKCRHPLASIDESICIEGGAGSHAGNTTATPFNDAVSSESGDAPGPGNDTVLEDATQQQVIDRQVIEQPATDTETREETDDAGGLEASTDAPSIDNPRADFVEQESIFSFNTSRWGWLPSFSFEVFQQSSYVPISEAVVAQVQEILPNVPASVIAQDLAITNSAESTVNRLMVGSFE